MAYFTKDGVYQNPRHAHVHDGGDPRYRAAERLAGAVEDYLYNEGSPQYRNLDYLIWHVANYDAAKSGRAEVQNNEWSPEKQRESQLAPVPAPDSRANPNTARDIAVRTSHLPEPKPSPSRPSGPGQKKKSGDK